MLHAHTVNLRNVNRLEIKKKKMNELKKKNNKNKCNHDCSTFSSSRTRHIECADYTKKMSLLVLLLSLLSLSSSSSKQNASLTIALILSLFFSLLIAL